MFDLHSMLIALAWLIIAILGDVLSVKWHKHREAKQAVKAANTGFVMAVLGWLPLVVLITTQNWLIIAADLVGNWLGSYWGVKWYEKDTQIPGGDSGTAHVGRQDV